MTGRPLLVVVLVLSAVALDARADDPPDHVAYDRGAALRDAGRHADALAAFREGLEETPGSRLLLAAAGLEAYELGDGAASAEYYGRWRALEPTAWRALAGLVRAHQLTGDGTARDEARAALFALRAGGEAPELNDQRVYWRDRFVVGPWQVRVFEHFELVGRRAARVGFVVERRATDPPAPESFRISLGSYDTTNESLRAKGLLPADRRAYHLDLHEGLGHATLGMWVDEPPYDEVRARVIAALERRARGEDPAAGVAPVASPTPGGR